MRPSLTLIDVAILLKPDALARLLALAWLLVASAALGDTSKSVPARVADGELRACQIVSVDQAWAVGVRGLILTTNDAGKTWTQQSPRADYQLNAVVFANPQQGIALGGTIDPYSHRSIGTILTTQDGGKNWTAVPNSLPRLTGVQWIEQDHLLAWGDWSQLQQSALFESLDNGQTWASRPIPCSHVQAAAVGANNSLLVIDRAGRVHFAKGGLDFQQANIPTHPFDPLRFCKFQEDVWWLGGDAGQLYRSRDGENWERILLPGIESDHSLISLTSLASQGLRVCLAGEPGNVVWISEDGGDTWSVRQLDGTSANKAISTWGADVIMMCGSDTTIRSSRNGGKAWWTQHQCGGRSAVLNVATVYSSIAWDLLAHVSLEQRRSAALLILHEQQLQDRIGIEPEQSVRIQLLADSVSLQQAKVLPHYPAGSLAAGWRDFDLNYYAPSTSNGSSSSGALPITPVHRIVQEIRELQPEVVVYPDGSSTDPLEVALSQATEQAIKLAAKPDYHLFSKVSGIPNNAWQPQKTLVRTKRPGLSFPKPMVLKNLGIVLGSALASVKPMLDYETIDSEPTGKIFYRVAGSKSGTLRDPLEGVILDHATSLLPGAKSSHRLEGLMANCTLVDWQAAMKSEPSSPFASDRNWEISLAGLAKEVSPEIASPLLLEIAIAERRKANWARWQFALETLLERDGISLPSEAAYWEWMSHLGSEEVSKVIRWQKKDWETRTHRDNVQVVKNLEQASPFATPSSKEGMVLPASFVTSNRKVAPSIDRDLHEFSRLLARWPSRMQSLRSEARWGWLIASRYQAMQRNKDTSFAGVQLDRSPSLFWPLLSPSVPTWQTVASSERSIQQDSHPVPRVGIKPEESIRVWGKTNQRPFLDGDAEESMWKNAQAIQIQDPWRPSESPTTTLWLSHDEEFLYIFSYSTEPKTSPQDKLKSQVVKSNGNRAWDQVSLDEDHVRIRFDLDRDYTTWYEFAWARSGSTSDSCGDMMWWNPTWHIATKNHSHAWTAEIAIPLEQLLEDKAGEKITWANSKKTPWSINAIRHVPSETSLTLAPFVADQMSRTEWVTIKD